MRKFTIGDKVEHKLFGKGRILDIEYEGFDREGSVGDNTKLTIEFKRKTSKKIISKYVKLVKE